MEDVRRLPVGEDNEIAVTLDDLAREGARRMIAAALKAETDEYVASFVEAVGEDGKRLVVRNGRARERKLTIGSGTVPIRAPRVNDKRADEQTGKRQRFSSRILPAYARRSPKVNDVLPVLYLRGLSTGDFRPALEQLLGEDAAGLSPSTISRLCKDWEAEHEHALAALSALRVLVRRWRPRLGQARRGRPPVPARRDRCARGSDQGAAGGRGRLPREHRVVGGRDARPQGRGLNEPKLVIGDGALGTWAALHDVYPTVRRQACWVHAIARVLDALPKRLQPRAKTMLHEMMEAPTCTDARQALERFRSEFDAKYPKAVAKLPPHRRTASSPAAPAS